ncbi:MAG: 3-oxoacyl-ACP synthase [Clostridia bacterium]|nr:3-oxoacyl-ACP synthase [Clostridia bacterium]
MRNIKIIGYGSYVPENKVMFGNQTRYRANNEETQVDMNVKACNKAIESAKLDISQIDLIICASAVMAQLLPATSSLIHEKIAKGLTMPAIDVNTSCSSFLTALDIASHYIELGTYKNILIVSGDICSKGLNKNQKESYELFSDGSAAVVVTKGNENEGIIDSMQRTYSEGTHLTEIRGGGTLEPGYEYTEQNKADYLFDMKGKEILLTTARIVPTFLNDFLSRNNLSIDEIDLIIPHQASKALGMIMDRFKIPKEKYINWVDDYGNMVSASIPFVLCKLLENGDLKDKHRIMLFGTAAGLTINGIILDI